MLQYFYLIGESGSGSNGNEGVRVDLGVKAMN